MWPRPVPPELITALLKAVDDENPKVRIEAIYTLGSIAQPPLAADAARQLIKALDHYDPAIRAAAARVDRALEGHVRRRRADQGGQRLAAAGAIRGDAGARRHPRGDRRRGADAAVGSTMAAAKGRGRRSTRLARIAPSVERAALQVAARGSRRVHPPRGRRGPGADRRYVGARRARGWRGEGFLRDGRAPPWRSRW